MSQKQVGERLLLVVEDDDDAGRPVWRGAG